MRRDRAGNTLVLLGTRGVCGEHIRRSGTSPAVDDLWVGGMRREVARSIIGLVRITSLLVGYWFPGRRSLVNGHAEFGSHVGRRLGTSYAIPRLRPAWRGER
jgi:hypothetical protein